MTSLRDLVEANPTLTRSAIEQYDPVDALWSMNPELATLAYAHRNKWLTPDVLPAIVKFRGMQSDEKMGLLQAIVDKCSIESDERKNMVNSVSAQNIVASMQAGETARESMRTEAALEAQRLKYEVRWHLINQQFEGAKHLSDNELKAVAIEAHAIYETITESEKIKAYAQVAEKHLEVQQRIQSIEIAYVAKMKEAELVRAATTPKFASEIVVEYLRMQAEMMRYAIEANLCESRERSSFEQSIYRAFADTARSLADVLKSTKKSSVLFSGEAGDKKINLRMEVE